MEIYQFKKEVGKKITKFDSDFVMSRITQTDKVALIGRVHLDENGLIGYHPAVVPQLLLVVHGEGWVRVKLRNTSKFTVAKPCSGIKMNGTKPKRILV